MKHCPGTDRCRDTSCPAGFAPNAKIPATTAAPAAPVDKKSPIDGEAHLRRILDGPSHTALCKCSRYYLVHAETCLIGTAWPLVARDIESRPVCRTRTFSMSCSLVLSRHQHILPMSELG